MCQMASGNQYVEELFIAVTYAIPVAVGANSSEQHPKLDVYSSSPGVLLRLSQV